MKRTMLAVATLLALVLMPALGGCTKASSDDTATQAETATTAQAVAVEGFDAMPTDGVNETAALAAAKTAFENERANGDWHDVDFAALAATEPRLVAYLVEVQMDGQTALFEVRADGIAHTIYNYQRAFDSGTMIWSGPDEATMPTVAKSPGEMSAAAAVDAAMRDAFPDGVFTVAIHGYRFAYVAEGLDPFTLEIAPDGTMLTVGM